MIKKVFEPIDNQDPKELIGSSIYFSYEHKVPDGYIKDAQIIGEMLVLDLEIENEKYELDREQEYKLYPRKEKLFSYNRLEDNFMKDIDKEK